MPMPLQENIGGNTPLIDDDTIRNIINRLRGLLDEENFEKVEGALLGMAKMSMDGRRRGARDADLPLKTASEAFDYDALEGLTGKERDAALVEQAMQMLRRGGFDEADIDSYRKKRFGLDRPTIAQDSARRERDAANYRKMFPHAPMNSGEATVPRRREPHPRDPESYRAMFPQAGRLG